MKYYDHLTFLRTSVVQFQAFQYIIGLNRTFEFKVLAVWIFFAHWCLISTISIYYVPESDIRVKSYHHLNFSRLSNVQFRATRYIISLNRTSESEVMAIGICPVLPCLISSISIYYVPEIGYPSKKLWPFDLLESFRCSISSVSIYYWLGTDIRVKRCGRLNLPCASMFYFKHIDILCAWIRQLSERFWPFEYLEIFHCSILSVSIYYWSISDIRVKSYGRLNLPSDSMFNFELHDILCAWIGIRV